MAVQIKTIAGDGENVNITTTMVALGTGNETYTELVETRCNEVNLVQTPVFENTINDPESTLA